MIRDLSAAIQRKVFAPEFRPAASRYSRLIKGKADVSFLGFKLSLEPSQETVDELLDDIDEVLRRIGRRVIIVIDDLDRLDAKTAVKSFVIYQLSNPLPPNGSGVGCGHYDERGAGDSGGIARLMSEYAFGVCFNPDIHEDNVFHFLDHCLSSLSNSFFSGRDEEGYFASKAELPRGLDPTKMGRYWSQHRELIRQRVLNVEERYVVTSNYIASYHEDLAGVFAILDELADEATAVEAESDKLLPSPS